MNFTETENLVDFGLGLYAKEYYEAARTLKDNGSKGTPYHLMLAISAECFLKSIRTTTLWYRGLGVKVNHTKRTHDLTSIFHELECNHPRDAEFLKNGYMSKYSRSFKEDLELNKNVFTLRRYLTHIKERFQDLPLLLLGTNCCMVASMKMILRFMRVNSRMWLNSYTT